MTVWNFRPLLAEHLLVAGELVRPGSESTRLQPACRSGSSTFLDGLSILAVSAMKRTPQKTIDRRIDLGRLAGQLEAVAGDVGQFLDLALLVVVGEDGGADLLLEVEDFGGDVVERRRAWQAPLFFSVAEGQPTHRFFTDMIRRRTRRPSGNGIKAIKAIIFLPHPPWVLLRTEVPIAEKERMNTGTE